MIRILSLLVLLFLACDYRPTWHLDQPIYVSTAWNLPQPEAFRRGVEEAIISLGGIIKKGAGPQETFAPLGTQVIHIWDNAPGSGKCDSTGNILGFADDSGIHVCHNPAVFSMASNDPSVSARGAKITAMHETFHLGGLSWHWSCDELAGQKRIMADARACELLDRPTEEDLIYACTGGLFVGGRCSIQ